MNNSSGVGDEQTSSADADSGRSGSGSGFSRQDAERQARDAIGNARDELQSLLENQKNAAAHQVQDVAAALRRTASELREREQTTVATYVANVADRIDEWSARLEQRHISQLGQDMRTFANERPALFIAGAVVLGFAAARFLKSSESTYRQPARRGSRDSLDTPSTSLPKS